MKTCLYCKNEKEDAEFSQEHVLPRGVGGNLINNPFSIKDVCAKCNNLCGLFVDGPFIKSWFINNYRSQIAQKYCHLTSETVLPLSFMGEFKEFNYEDKICELWLGPAGDTIYHFHKPYPEEDTPHMVGTPPTAYKKNLDPGFVFIFIRANNPVWHPTIIFSTIFNFKKSILYLGNGQKPNLTQFKEVPKELKELHSRLINFQEKEHSNSIIISIDYADRFLCKLALGMGSLLLKSDFKNSEDADLLRAGLWTKKLEDRKKLKIRGSNFLGGKEHKENLDEIFKWPGGHCLAVIKNQNGILLFCNFYEQNSAAIKISGNVSHWPDDSEGKIFVMVPSLSKAVGPIDFLEFIGHKVEPPIKHSGLEILEQEMQQFTSHPPFNL